MNLFSLIKDLALIPSYTGSEELIHPYIKQFVQQYLPSGTEIIEIKKSLFIKIPGDSSRAPVAFSAHLDKIKHKSLPKGLEVDECIETDTKITGHLDDSVGLSLSLYLAHLYNDRQRPPIYLFLTEKEETGHIGAFHFKLFFDRNRDSHRLPWLIINFDVIPTSSEKNRVYLNTEMPYYTLLDRIAEVVKENLGLWQGRSDYAVYSNFFEECVPFSIEPAIRNLHKIGETCFKIDIENSIKVAVNLIDSGENWLKEEKCVLMSAVNSDR